MVLQKHQNVDDINPFQNNKFKTSADLSNSKFKIGTIIVLILSETVGNIIGKGENIYDRHFLLFPLFQRRFLRRSQKPQPCDNWSK